jgi:hypothetical protein
MGHYGTDLKNLRNIGNIGRLRCQKKQLCWREVIMMNRPFPETIKFR